VRNFLNNKWSNVDYNLVSIYDCEFDVSYFEYEISNEFIKRGFKFTNGYDSMYDVCFNYSNFYLEILERNKDLPKVCEKIKSILLEEKKINQEIEDYAHEVFSEWLFTQKPVKAKSEFKDSAAENINSI